MSCYISSNNNRIYVALEQSYGQVSAITETNRIPAVKFDARQTLDTSKRRDKTGSRTFVGLPNRMRRNTTYQLNTFLTQWSGEGAPAYGALFQAGMGGAPQSWAGATVASITGETQIAFTADHGLSAGQAVGFNGEIRFVTAIVSTTAVVLNAPFSVPPVSGSAMTPTVTYKLETDLGSVSVFDYWDPSTVVQRIVNGAGVDIMKVKVNGDFHEFEFSGPSQDLLDNVSFTSGLAGLTQFPAEPEQIYFDYTIVPGHLGQVWMGVFPHRFLTLTEAELVLDNNIAPRANEFGSDAAQCLAGGQRSVTLNFSILEHDDDPTKELYQAARQRSPVGVMLQLGEQPGQLFGAYLPAMVPEVPQFDDSQSRLEWKFSNSRGQGTVNDELYVAFG